ncbi:hypothetical protein KCP73_14965 [Salmonella enterica subsp. enterica]|nr:hypothetical protein KCP73_14965 [Salmonella enterica subsp. enterica]
MGRGRLGVWTDGAVRRPMCDERGVCSSGGRWRRCGIADIATTLPAQDNRHKRGAGQHHRTFLAPIRLVTSRT